MGDKNRPTKKWQIKHLESEILRLREALGERWDAIHGLEQEVAEYEEIVRKNEQIRTRVYLAGLQDARTAINCLISEEEKVG